jgi:hypothetical protein
LLVGEYSYIAAASIGIRATQSQLAMSTRSGRQSDTAPTPQQQHEVLNEVLEQLRSLNQKTDVTNQRVDRIWIHVFDKPGETPSLILCVLFLIACELSF